MIKCFQAKQCKKKVSAPPPPSRKAEGKKNGNAIDHQPGQEHNTILMSQAASYLQHQRPTSPDTQNINPI